MPDPDLFGAPKEGSLSNPQRLNRYSYCLNNPYKYVDPDGRFSMYAQWDVASGWSYQFKFMSPADPLSLIPTGKWDLFKLGLKLFAKDGLEEIGSYFIQQGVGPAKGKGFWGKVGQYQNENLTDQTLNEMFDEQFGSSKNGTLGTGGINADQVRAFFASINERMQIDSKFAEKIYPLNYNAESMMHQSRNSWDRAILDNYIPTVLGNRPDKNSE